MGEKGNAMKRTETPTGIFPDDVKAELQEAVENTKGGIADAEAANKACERMDRIRAENRALFGETAIAVELIRQSRDRQ
jgi:hypothetical protein